MTKASTPIIALSLAMLVLAGVIMFKPFNSAQGAAFTGLASYLQTATTTTVGPQGNAGAAITIAAAQTDGSCKARVVTTTSQGIMISFGDTTGFGSTTIGGQAGHLQAASTTVAYDGGIYGCGRMSAYGFASTTITVSQF